MRVGRSSAAKIPRWLAVPGGRRGGRRRRVLPTPAPRVAAARELRLISSLLLVGSGLAAGALLTWATLH